MACICALTCRSVSVPCAVSSAVKGTRVGVSVGSKAGKLACSVPSSRAVTCIGASASTVALAL